MERLLFLFFNLFALVLGQGAPAPEISASAAPSAGSCNGCYVVADVAVVIFGKESITETATNFVSVGVGKNGTQITTSFVQAGNPFSFGPSGLLTAGASGAPAVFTGTEFTLSGATLTSPTAYNVFTAYSITSVALSNGQCVTSSGAAIAVSPAYSVAVPPNPGPDYIFQAEESFISDIGGVSCAPGGLGSSSTTTPVPVSITTVANTVTGPLRPTPAPQNSATSVTSTQVVSALPETVSSSASSSSGTGVITIQASSTAVSAVSLSNNSTGTLVIVGNSTGIVTGSGPSATVIPFTPFPGAASVIFKPSMLFSIAALLTPGILAWLL